MLSKFFKPILLQRPFCAIAGGILGGLLLTQACVYEDMANSRGLFVPRTYVQWEKDTGMTRKEIDAALATVVEQGLLETKEDRPEILRFRVRHEVVDAKLARIGEIVEPEKKEAITEQLHLPVVVPEEPSQIVVAEPEKINIKKLTDEQINEIFFPVYQEHKFWDWATHKWLPPDSIKAIRNFIKEQKFTAIEDAIAGFAAVLIWCREGESDFYRKIHKMPLTHITSNKKLSTFFDSARDAMETDLVYKSKVANSSESMDVERVAPGLAPEQKKKAQAALEVYREQQEESAAKIVIHTNLWEENKNDNS